MCLVKDMVAGQTVIGFYIIKSVEEKKASNEKPYLDFVLTDRTGEIMAKLWDRSEEDKERYIGNALVKMELDIRLWKDKKQATVKKHRLAAPQDPVKLHDFIQTAPYDPADMYRRLQSYINQIQNPDIQNIVRIIVDRYEPQIMYYPAAQKNHHAFHAGLLYHVTTMLKSAEKLMEVYTFLNRDLLYAGIILHDIEKINEMEANELGFVQDYTKVGKLLGHITQGVLLIERVGKELEADPEIIMLLQHMVLSHHYKGEWGSPKGPQIPEAEMLHYIDMIDAKMNDVSRAIEKTEQGEFSEKIYTLDNRSMYAYQF